MPSAKPLTDLSRLCIHTITTKPWTIEEAISRYASAGVAGISVWRDAVEGKDLSSVRTQIEEAGLTTVSYVRGGFFPAGSKEERQKALDENCKIIEEAYMLGSPLVVLVCGADPAQSLRLSQQQIRQSITELIPFADGAGIKLGIEPLHPLYADTRSAIVTLEQANLMVEKIGSSTVGVVLDVYHVWWDPNLKREIKRCIRNESLFAFHVCDWRVPTRDLLNDRELMGKGCIDIKEIRTQLERLGYDGFIEVEIFSDTYWALDQSDFLNQIVSAYKQHV